MFDEQEPGKFEVTPELAAVERKLADLTPMAPRIDRAQLMYNAGRAAALATQASRVVRSAERAECSDPDLLKTHYFWPAATVTMTAATILLSAMLVRQHSTQSVTQKVVQPQVSAVADTSNIPLEQISARSWAAQSTRGYLGLRRVALTRGISSNALEFNFSLPATQSQAKPATARELLNELLPNAIHQRS
jgi:hypothetical protein